MQAEVAVTPPSARRARACASPRPSRRARRSPARARASGRASPRCLRGSARRRRRRSGRRVEQVAGGAERRSFSASVSMCRSERNGQITSGTRSATGGSRRSPRRRSTSSRTPASSAAPARRASIPGDESTPITRIPRFAIGTRCAGPDRELDHRAAGRERLLDVEADVLRDRAAPRVVERRDRVVERHQPACGRPRRTRGSVVDGRGRTSRRAPRSRAGDVESPSHSERVTHQQRDRAVRPRA